MLPPQERRPLKAKRRRRRRPPWWTMEFPSQVRMRTRIMKTEVVAALPSGGFWPHFLFCANGGWMPHFSLSSCSDTPLGRCGLLKLWLLKLLWFCSCGYFTVNLLCFQFFLLLVLCTVAFQFLAVLVLCTEAFHFLAVLVLYTIVLRSPLFFPVSQWIAAQL